MMNSSISYGHMWGAPWFYGFGQGPALFFSLLLAVAFMALIALKGYALWTAAKRDQKWWFIAILLLNTMGLLEAVYIVFFVKEWHKKRTSHTHHGDHPHTPAQ
ncbi:MAG: DUF5652 family protein [Candidatus Pacebacteria bacterium]|nr:DUF5652 family protein [Candidatus Paceibacterota bacterium]